jgi:hypothetical protein
MLQPVGLGAPPRVVRGFGDEVENDALRRCDHYLLLEY